MTICKGKGNEIELLKELNYPHSLGLLYSAFTYFLGFKVNSGEYKLMGLAPYGNPNSDKVSDFIKKIKEELVDIKDDGSIFLNQSYFKYTTQLKMIDEKAWERLFDLVKRNSEDSFDQQHCDLAMAIQKVTEEIVLKIVNHAKDITDSENLCLAGGVALNCVSNGNIVKSESFKNIFIQPAAGDAGGAIGCALAFYYIHEKNERNLSEDAFIQKHTYYGPSYNRFEIEKKLKQLKLDYNYYEEFDSLSNKVATLISEGNVVGWFQGAMEFGPRALGNRSILGDPRNPEMKKIINLKIKFRESFRPFAPSILKEDIGNWFENVHDSEFMLLVDDIKSEHRLLENTDKHSLDLREKTYLNLSNLPAITHFDHSCRIQTVDKETNYRYWKLITDFKAITNVGVVIRVSSFYCNLLIKSKLS